MLRFNGTTWTSIAGLPSPKTRLAAAVLGGNLYAIAGNSGGSTNVFAFNGTSWSEVRGLPAAREWLAAGTLGSLAYAIAGGNQTNVYAFDGTSWTQARGLPAAREKLAVAVASNKLYAIGGNTTTNVFVFDGTNWIQMAGLPQARQTLAAATLDGQVYAIGGENAGGKTNVYRLTGTSWAEAPSLPAARIGLTASVLSNKLYAIGGSDQTNVYRYPAGGVYSGVSPESGSYTGGFSVTISGTSLSDGTTEDVTEVTLCGAIATVTAVNGTTQIVVTARATAAENIGLGDVRVVSDSEGESVKTNGFTYSGAPGLKVLGVDAATIANAAGVSRASGTLFVPALPVGAGAITNTFSLLNSGSEDLSISSATFSGAGAAQFAVAGVPATIGAGTAASNITVVFTPSTNWSYVAALSVAHDAPGSVYTVNVRGMVYDAYPSSGPLAGGTEVWILDGHYGTVTNVTVDGEYAGIAADDQDWVVIETPASGTTGAKDIVIQTSDYGDFTLAGAFTYNPTGYINRITYDYDNWESAGTPLSQYAEYPSMAVYSNALYLIGGHGLTNVYRFANNTWTEVAGLPHPIFAAVAGTMNGYIYLAGGMNPEGSAVTNQVYRFNGTSWTRIADMDYPRALAAGAVVNGKFHIFGGLDEVGGLPTTSVVFDGTNWLSQSFGTVFGVRLGVAAVGTNVYVSGGYYGGAQVFYHRLYITNELNQMAYGSQTFMPNGRAYHASAMLDDNVYVIAGRVGGTATAGSWCYNFTNKLADPPNLPQALDSIAAATYRKSIYVTGGSTLNNTTNVYRYPAQSGTEGVVPDFGVRNGGYQVTIIGSNLGDGTDITNVTLCGVSAASIDSQSSTQVIITAGAASQNATGDVVVFSTSYGESLLEDAFTYDGTGKDQQTITFAPIANQTRSSVVRLAATASSGLPVTFSVVSGPATLSGTNLSFTSEGAVSVKAAQAGNVTYDPAPDVVRSFFVLGTFSVRAVAMTNNVTLRWSNPGSAGFSNQTSLVRFSTNDYPDTTSDGSSLYTGTNQVYIHTGLTPGQPYYYTVFLSHDGSSFTNPP